MEVDSSRHWLRGVGAISNKDLGYELLLLEADIRFTSMSHCVEQRMQVHNLYWKDFTDQVLLTGQPPQVRTYRMIARDLMIDPEVSFAPVQKALEERSLWTSMTLNYSKVALSVSGISFQLQKN